MSATLKMKKWRDNFLQIPEGLRGHPMSELEEVASTLTAIVNMTDDSHIQDMAKFCITEVIAADKEIAKRKDMYHECRVLRVKDKKVHLQEIATRDAELARLREDYNALLFTFAHYNNMELQTIIEAAKQDGRFEEFKNSGKALKSHDS